MQWVSSVYALKLQARPGAWLRVDSVLTTRAAESIEGLLALPPPRLALPAVPTVVKLSVEYRSPPETVGSHMCWSGWLWPGTWSPSAALTVPPEASGPFDDTTLLLLVLLLLVSLEHLRQAKKCSILWSPRALLLPRQT